MEAIDVANQYEGQSTFNLPKDVAYKVEDAWSYMESFAKNLRAVSAIGLKLFSTLQKQPMPTSDLAAARNAIRDLSELRRVSGSKLNPSNILSAHGKIMMGLMSMAELAKKYA
jgi:hypothetical protein